MGRRSANYVFLHRKCAANQLHSNRLLHDVGVIVVDCRNRPGSLTRACSLPPRIGINVTDPLTILAKQAIAAYRINNELDRMTPDRNASEHANWYGSWTALLRLLRALRKSPLAAGGSPGKKAFPIESALSEKQEEDLPQEAEPMSLPKGKLFALKVQKISDAQIAKATLDYHHSKLNSD